MFWAEAAFHPLSVSLSLERAPLAGVIGEKKLGGSDDSGGVDNHDHHDHITWPSRPQDAHIRYLRWALQ